MKARDRHRRRLLRWMGAAGIVLAGASCGRRRQPTWTGAAFPDFALPDMKGAQHRKRDYAGHPLLVNLWATWCPPCRAEMHDLVQLAETLAPRGLRFVAVSVDDDRWLVAEYLLREKLDCTVLLDPGHGWSDAALGVPGFPATYLVGADGIIRTAWLGPRSWTSTAMQAEVATFAGLP